MHIIAIAVCVCLYISALVCIFSGISQTFDLQAEIKTKLPESEKVEPLFWSYATWSRFRELQRRILPDSPRPKKIRRYALAGMSLLLAAILLTYLAIRT